MLFDLQNDPGESTSRAQDPAHAATASELKRGWVLTDDNYLFRVSPNRVSTPSAYTGPVDVIRERG